MATAEIFQSMVSIVFATITPLQAISSVNLLEFQYRTCVIEKTMQYHTPQERELIELSCVPEFTKPVNEVEMGGWIPYWEVTDGIATVNKYKSTMDSVSPFWYAVHSDGTLKKQQGYMNADLLQVVNSTNIEITPTITSFDADIFAQVMESPENMQRHIQSIINEIDITGVDGIDLDYEKIYLRNKDQFFIFLNNLSYQLKAKDKKLVFTAMPKWGDEVTYPAYVETRQVLDYGKIAEVVDEFRIMTYEFTGRQSTHYGPNAPLDWIEDVMRYAIKEGVPRDKLVMALPLYSYDYFPTSGPLSTIDYYPRLNVPFDANQPSALAYFNNTVDIAKSDYEVTSDTFNTEWGESVLNYMDGNESRFIVYPSQQSIDARKQLVAKYGIKGIYYWRLGDETGLQL